MFSISEIQMDLLKNLVYIGRFEENLLDSHDNNPFYGIHFAWTRLKHYIVLVQLIKTLFTRIKLPLEKPMCRDSMHQNINKGRPPPCNFLKPALPWKNQCYTILTLKLQHYGSFIAEIWAGETFVFHLSLRFFFHHSR